MPNSIKILLNPFTVRHKTSSRSRNIDAKETKPRIHIAVCPVGGSHGSLRRERLELKGKQCTTGVNLCCDSPWMHKTLLLIFSPKSRVYKGSKLKHSARVSQHWCIKGDSSSFISRCSLIINLSPKGTRSTPKLAPLNSQRSTASKNPVTFREQKFNSRNQAKILP